MGKRLYIKPEIAEADMRMECNLMDPSQGIAPGGLAKENNELDEAELQDQLESQASQVSLW